MKSVRLDSKKLRALIESEVKKMKSLSEHADVLDEELNQSVEDLVDKVAIAWVNMPEQSDPSIELAGGWEAWEEQVEIAKEDLLNEINDAIISVEQKLNNGEYYVQKPGV